MAILRAILAGERAPQRLTCHRDPRCRHDQATIAKALAGHWQAEYLLALQQALEQYEFLQQQLRARETQIEACLQAFVPHLEVGPPQTTPARTRRSRQRQAPRFDVHGYLDAMTGGDLTQIDGIDALTALKVIREIGLDMTRWPTGKHFASWLGLGPGTSCQGESGIICGASRRPIGRQAPYGWQLKAESRATAPWRPLPGGGGRGWAHPKR